MKGSELDVRYQQCDGGSDDPTIPAAPGGHASDESAIFQLHGWQGWTPFFLRKKTLACFLACEVGLLLGLIALAVADENEAGIATVNNRIHYLWTFGPTAVLSVLAALWTQVEYRTKQAQPWSLLRKGPSPASKTLLLDYITTSTPEALFAALRAGHWAPVMAITSSILIKLLTVVSTGLLVLQNTDITRHDCRISTPDDFVNQFNSTKVGSAGALAALASLDQVMDPVGFTSMGVAFQSLKATDDTNSECQQPTNVVSGNNNKKQVRLMWNSRLPSGLSEGPWTVKKRRSRHTIPSVGGQHAATSAYTWTSVRPHAQRQMSRLDNTADVIWNTPPVVLPTFSRSRARAQTRRALQVTA